MNTDTATHTTPASWYVSNTPEVGARLVSELASGEAAQTEAATSKWEVVRYNPSTGRGTVQHTSGRKLQVVRGRFGWCLADGTARPVRFATEQRVADDGQPLFDDEVSVEQGSFWQPSYEAVPLEQPEPCVGCGSRELACDCPSEADVQPDPTDALAERLLALATPTA